MILSLLSGLLLSVAGTLAWQQHVRAPKAHERLPASPLESAHRAKAHFLRGEYREAEKIYETILGSAPDDLHALSNLGVARFRSGNFKSAEDVFRRATKVAPQDAFAHCTLGIVYYSQNRFDEAIQSLKRAVEIAPRNATAHNYLGICYAQKGMQKEADLQLEIARKLDPNYREADALPSEIPATFRTNEA